MKQKTIAQLKKLFANDEVSEELLISLQEDERKGVQSLLAKYEKNQKKKQMLLNNFEKMSFFENKCRINGYQYIAGVDEAGRGPLAGPVVAAAVILPADFKLLGLNDSKQLNPETRRKFFEVIKEQAISFGIALVNSQIIDQINIFEATKLAMYNALTQLNQEPDYVLIDAVKLDNYTKPFEAIEQGDEKSISIAAASILAKVTRDRVMQQIDIEYPVYNFKANKGYGTKDHLDALLNYGPSPYHRRSFAPVREIL